MNKVINSNEVKKVFPIHLAFLGVILKPSKTL